MKKKNILETLQQNPIISNTKKRIAWEKWKFNQLPDFYRKEHIADIKEKIKKIKAGVITKLSVLVEHPNCYTCKSTKFWKTMDGAINCFTCHPPVSEANVKEWIEQ